MATAELKPAPHASYSQGDFIVHDDVPLFYEHEGPDGTVYNREILKGMVETMNKRIRDKKNYSPLVAGHRPQGDEKKYRSEPLVIGFEGPYHLGVFGEEDPVWCIFAKEHVKKKYAELAADLPRRSVEVWPVSDPKERYFDPVAALGAETPNLDLGIVYSRTDMLPYRYEVPAAAPGGSNVYIPDLDDKKKKPHQYDQESAMDATQPVTPAPATGQGVGPSLNQADLQQIAQMVSALIDAKLDERSMQPEGAEESPPPLGQPPTEEAPPPPGLPATGAIPGEPQEDPQLDKNKPQQYSKHYEKVCQYAMTGDHDGACKYMEGLDESGMNEVAQQYDAESDDDRKSKLKPILEPHDMDTKQPTVPQQYAKQITDLTSEVHRYQKEASDWKTKAQQYEKDNAGLTERVTSLEEKDAVREQQSIVAIRYAKCSDLRSQGFNIQVGKPDDAAPTDDMRLALGLNDEQFEHFVTKIVPLQYARIQKKQLPGYQTSLDPLSATSANDDKGAKRREKAMRIAQESGNKIPFNQALVMADAS